MRRDPEIKWNIFPILLFVSTFILGNVLFELLYPDLRCPRRFCCLLRNGFRKFFTGYSNVITSVFPERCHSRCPARQFDPYFFSLLTLRASADEDSVFSRDSAHQKNLSSRTCPGKGCYFLTIIF
jgi:hypothetical protein